MSNTSIAWYLYCLTPPGFGVQISSIGVDGHGAVSVGCCGELDAVFSEVALEEFDGESAEAHLKDLAWLAPRVCRHEAVIEEVMSRSAAFPARFATLFTSLDSLQQSVAEHRQLIAGFFTELGDKQEWAVKGMLNRPDASGAPPSASQPGAGEERETASPGARYFEQKRIKAQWQVNFNNRLKEFGRHAATVLTAHAAGFKQRKVLATAASETDIQVVSNWAFLVSPAMLAGFKAGLEELNGSQVIPGFALTLTGPWPPYSFVPDLSHRRNI